MTRVLTGLAAWLAGTALAVGLAWSGANMVVRDAGVSPGVQVINADPPAPRAPPRRRPCRRRRRAARARARPPASDPARSAAASSPSRSGHDVGNAPATTSATAAGSVRSYTLAGGRVALLLTGTRRR